MNGAGAEPGPEPHVDPRRPEDPAVAEAQREKNPVRRAFKVLGPGLVTGASDDDPSGIGTYAQAGAQYGYATLWSTVLMLPLMVSIQYICAKIGLVSGRGLAGVLREHYPRWVVYPAVFAMVLANTLNAGADIGAIAAAINLLLPIPAVVFVVPVSVGIIAIQVFGTYRLIERTFKWLALALLAYIASALFAHPQILDVLRGTFIPTIHLDRAYIGILVALLGTTISPYLFFWQASQEVEEQLSIGRRQLWQRQGATRRELKYALADTIAGMAFSEVVAYFIILSTGATLFVAGKTSIGSATEAAQALKPIAGEAASLLLAVGLIGAGVMAVPILTGAAAYGLSEMFGWRAGLDQKPGRAPQFYMVIVVATVVGMLINFLGINPVTALVVSAVINGLLAPPILVLVMLASGNRAVMGERTNGRAVTALGWLTTIVMGLAALALIVTTLF
jgi:NRAMP (natural resistance-associated macrophage protein)-like metal ion transporter